MARDMKAGKIFTPEKIKIIKPGKGLKSGLLDYLLRMRMNHNADKGNLITWDLF